MNTQHSKGRASLARRLQTLGAIASSVLVGALVLSCVCPPAPSCPPTPNGATASDPVIVADAPTEGSCTCRKSASGSAGEFHNQGSQLEGAGIVGCEESLKARVRQISLVGVKRGGASVQNARVEKGTLVGEMGGAALDPADWAGVTFSANIDCLQDGSKREISARITGVLKDPVEQDTYLYAVDVRSPDTGAWVPACDGGLFAIPVAGTWDDAGSHVTAQDKFVFACKGGAIEKCYHWGYAPWKDAKYEKLHAACTRMARADYCSDGTPHTEDGSWIDVSDSENIKLPGGAPPAGAPPSPTFEAAWGPNGLVCINHLRYSTAGTPPCFCYVPHCESAQDAKTMVGSCESATPLLFSASATAPSGPSCDAAVPFKCR